MRTPGVSLRNKLARGPRKGLNLGALEKAQKVPGRHPGKPRRSPDARLKRAKRGAGKQESLGEAQGAQENLRKSKEGPREPRKKQERPREGQESPEEAQQRFM